MLSKSKFKTRDEFFKDRKKTIESRRWELTLDEVNSLIPVEFETYKNSKDIEDEFSYNDKYIKVKGLTHILTSAAAALKLHDNNVTLVSTYKAPVIEGYKETTVKAKLPKSFKAGVQLLDNALLKPKKQVKRDANGEVVSEEDIYVRFNFVAGHPAWLIMILFFYQEFAEYYEYYLANPDENVDLVEFDDASVKELIVEAATTSKIAPTLEDIKVTAHGVILLLCRNFNEKDQLAFETQMKNMKVSRLNTARSSIGAETGDYLFGLETIKQATKNWNQYMNLKRCVFEFASNCIDKPEIIGARGLLKGQQMAITRCMTAFCTVSVGNVTLAHCNINVIKEMKDFTKELQELKNREGDRWLFYRTLHPKEGKISIKKFTYLACAATYWYRKFIDGSEGMKKMTVPAKPQGYPNIDVEAETPITTDCFLDGEDAIKATPYTEDDKEFMKTLKIDLDKVQENLRVRGELTFIEDHYTLDEALEVLKGKMKPKK